jgi:hypothetical protein
MQLVGMQTAVVIPVQLAPAPQSVSVLHVVVQKSPKLPRV